jgi:hypothetical protein
VATDERYQIGNGKQSARTRSVTGKTCNSWSGTESAQDAEESNGRSSVGFAGTSRRSVKETVDASGEVIYFPLRRLCAGVAGAGVTDLCFNDTPPFWRHV